ncbi:hypothetical protein D3C87_1219440 [compost metagenome]
MRGDEPQEGHGGRHGDHHGHVASRSLHAQAHEVEGFDGGAGKRAVEHGGMRLKLACQFGRDGPPVVRDGVEAIVSARAAGDEGNGAIAVGQVGEQGAIVARPPVAPQEHAAGTEARGAGDRLDRILQALETLPGGRRLDGEPERGPHGIGRAVQRGAVGGDGVPAIVDDRRELGDRLLHHVPIVALPAREARVRLLALLLGESGHQALGTRTTLVVHDRTSAGSFRSLSTRRA